MTDDKYKQLELVEIAYGDDEPQKSTDQTQALIAKYPDLKVICSPTTFSAQLLSHANRDKSNPNAADGLKSAVYYLHSIAYSGVFFVS